MKNEKLKDYVKEAIKVSVTSLPYDVKSKLEEAYEMEEGLSKIFLKAIIDNVEIANNESRPICQDTGTFSFIVRRGNFEEHEVKEVIVEALKEASEEIPLRPNAIDFVTRKNLGGNIGRFIPWITWEYPEDNLLRITVVPKGGGSEVLSLVKILPPVSQEEEIIKIIVDDIFEAWAKPCPPLFLGVGIGPTSETATNVAKRALYERKIGERHKEEAIASLETKIIERANKLGIGTHGLGGKVSVLDVHLDYASIHPASLVVSVVGSCWALRRAILIVEDSKKAEIVSHNIKL
ncbi:MAG: fumarate hydratase [Thermoproteota archaeon]|nr:fumarate hydratase [Candidatus Brockarchaeota archaeon]